MRVLGHKKRSRLKAAFKREAKELCYVMVNAWCVKMCRRLGADAERRVLNLCISCGGEHYRALWDYVTTDTGAVAVCMKHYIGEATLWRVVKKYYEEFAAGL